MNPDRAFRARDEERLEPDLAGINAGEFGLTDRTSGLDDQLEAPPGPSYDWFRMSG
jgi:hypothetical protein